MQVKIKQMLKTNSYKETQFTSKIIPSKSNYSPFNKFNRTTHHNQQISPSKTVQPELQNEELFFQASLQYVNKKKVAHYFLFIDQIIGQGSFAKVYRGMNILTNETVAIKVMQMKYIVQKKLYALLQAQIEIFKSLKHPNALRCYDILITDNHCYIVTELCNDGELKNYIEKLSKIKQNIQEFNTLLEPLIYDIYQGLLYLERKGILHRDIKMTNILVKEGKIKIADFGFATFSKSSFADLMVGSPIYMAPQSFLNNIYSSKTDVWAFGILLYELFHSVSPFEHCMNNQQLQSQLRIPFSKDRIKVQISEQLSQLICECLTFDHHTRPSFKQLWKNGYIKNLRFKSYVESKKLVNYKETSAKKNQQSQYVKQDSVIETNQSFNFINDSRVQSNLNQQVKDENSEGYFFEDFLKINQTQITEYGLSIDSNIPYLNLKNTQSQTLFENGHLKNQQKSPKSTFEQQMQEFYRQAQNMMQSQENVIKKAKESPILKINKLKNQANPEDNPKNQQISQTDQTIKDKPNKQNTSNPNQKTKNSQHQEINKTSTQIKTQLIQQNPKSSSCSLKDQSPNSSPRRYQKINLNKNFCSDSTPCQSFLQQKNKESNTSQLKKSLVIQFQSNQKNVSSQTPEIKHQQVQKSNQMSQIQQYKMKYVSSQQVTEPIDDKKGIKQEKIGFTKKSTKESCNQKQLQQKTHNQNLQKFRHLIYKNQHGSMEKTGQRQRQMMKLNKQAQQIDQIFVLLEFSRFIFKFFRFSDNLTDQFNKETKLDQNQIQLGRPETIAIQSVTESYMMIFTSYTLNRQIFLQQELFIMCQIYLMKRVTQISLNIDSVHNRDLFQIIKAHRKILRSFKEEKLNFKNLESEQSHSQKHQNQFMLHQIYKAIKILQEPITKLVEFPQSFNDHKVLIMGQKICWMGLWLSKIYDILIEVQIFFQSKSKMKDLNGRQHPLKLIKKMQSFVESYESAQINLKAQTLDSQLSVYNNPIVLDVQNNPPLLDKDLLKDDINFFFQLVYEIELKRMKLQTE